MTVLEDLNPAIGPGALTKDLLRTRCVAQPEHASCAANLGGRPRPAPGCEPRTDPRHGLSHYPPGDVVGQTCHLAQHEPGTPRRDRGGCHQRHQARMGRQLAGHSDPVAHRERRHAQRQGQFLLRRLMHARARPRWGEDHLVGTRGYDERPRCTGRHPRRARLPRCRHDHLAGARPSGRMPRSRPPWRGFTRMPLRAGTGGRRLGERGSQPRAGGQPQQLTNVIAQGDVPPVRASPVRPLIEPPRPEEPLETLVEHCPVVRGWANPDLTRHGGETRNPTLRQPHPDARARWRRTAAALLAGEVWW